MADFVPTQQMTDAAKAVFMAMAELELVRPVVTAYQRAILAAGQWRIRPNFQTRMGDDVILDPDRTHLLSDEDAAEYHARCAEAAKAASLTVSKPGNCPLLDRDYALIQAHVALIAVVGPAVGMDSNQQAKLFGEKRKQFVELALRLLAPSVNAEMQSN